MNLDNEVWRPVEHRLCKPGYEISNYGRMRDPEGNLLEPLEHGDQGGRIHYHPARKYPKDHLDLQAARAVLEAFRGPAPVGAYASFKDGDKTNLCVDNLEWVVRGQDFHGILPQPKGEAHGSAKLTADQVRDIRAYPSYRGSQKDLAEKYGVSVSLVSAILKRKLWKHI